MSRPVPQPSDAGTSAVSRRTWRLALLAALPIALALFFGIVVGVFAEKISAGITALILGLPLAIVVGVLVGRASSQSATAIEESSGITRVREAIASLDFRTDPDQPERIEILHPGLEADGSAADAAILNLARRLTERGHRPRLILLGEEPPERGWRDRLAANPEIGAEARQIEAVAPTAEGPELLLNPDDRVIATDWRSAHTADRLCLDLSSDRFTYLIHDFQPFRYPMGSFAALADASYELPHRAIFLDGLLRDYFSDQRLGVFAAGPRLGLRDTITVEEPILPVRCRSEAELAGTDRHRLLIHSGMDREGTGDLYELAVMALDHAVLNGHFRSWDLAALGRSGGDTSIVLPRSSAPMRVLDPGSPAAYTAMISDFDVGVALHYSPGLGTAAIELAAAGMSVVAGTFAGKDAAALAAVSANLIAADPRLDAIIAGLGEAERRTGDLATRLAGAQVNRATGWDAALDDRAMGAIEQQLGQRS